MKRVITGGNCVPNMGLDHPLGILLEKQTVQVNDMMGVLPFREDPDLSANSFCATSATLDISNITLELVRGPSGHLDFVLRTLFPLGRVTLPHICNSLSTFG